MSAQQPPYPRFPISEASVDENTRQKVQTVTTPWGLYFRNLRDDVDNAAIAQETFSTPTTGSSASIGTTTIFTPGQDGVFAFQYYAAVITPATTGAATSSLITTLSWTDGGISKAKSFPAMTGNTNGTTDSNNYLIVADGAAPISYSTTYASDTAGQMVYKLFGLVSSVASA